MWGNAENEGRWGNSKQAEKKIKEQGLFGDVFKKGNWGHGETKNLGLHGFRGTPEENAEIGKAAGKALGGRKRER